MANVAVIGAQWGDEGKGKVVDIYGRHADYIVRYQGGNNAGHTLVVDGKKVVLHLIPSAALHDKKTCVIGNGVVVDPEIFLHELKSLKDKGYLTSSKVFISDRSHVIMPYHKQFDQLRESRKGATSIGTTGRGIGPAYSDKIGRIGIRMGDLLNPNYLRARLEETLPEKNCLLQHMYGQKALDVNELAEKALALGEELRPYIADTNVLLHEAVQAGKRILLEGAQGTLLDIDHGTYPFVTSSNTTSGGAATGAGIPPHQIHEVIAIVKAYTTRVGGGPFPTEQLNEIGDRLQSVGAEIGATTGRRRRCGWLDLVALRHAKDTNGFTGLAVTKLDVLSGLPHIDVCVGYEYKGRKLKGLPASIEEFAGATPVYKRFKAWKETITDLSDASQVPVEMRDYLKFVEDELGVKTVLLSVGPDRKQTVELRNPFA